MIRATSLVVVSMALFTGGCIVDETCYDCAADHHDYYPQPDPTPTPAMYERISQFATGARASSEGIPGSLDFSAARALGTPDVTVCGDSPDAWSPFEAEPSMSGPAIDDWLEVTFDSFVWVSEIRIYESFNPGAIVAVDLEASDGLSTPVVLFENFYGNGQAPCGTFNIVVDEGTTFEQFDRVVIYFDTNLVGDANFNGNWHDDFNEIDAVQMIGDVQIF